MFFSPASRAHREEAFSIVVYVLSRECLKNYCYKNSTKNVRGEVGRGWLENNITASLAFAFARVAHPHPSSVSPTKSITRNDSLLYRRLYILFLCFHVRQKHSEKKLLEAAAERRIKRKESNNTSIQSIVIAVGG